MPRFLEERRKRKEKIRKDKKREKKKEKKKVELYIAHKSGHMQQEIIF
jgi:hypothetical protein